MLVKNPMDPNTSQETKLPQWKYQKQEICLFRHYDKTGKQNTYMSLASTFISQNNSPF